MADVKIFEKIKKALDESPRNAYTAELHLQIIKYADQLEGTTGKDFCEFTAIPASYTSEYAKMIKIAGRLRQAGLDPDRI